jgi:hypothetical protein
MICYNRAKSQYKLLCIVGYTKIKIKHGSEYSKKCTFQNYKKIQKVVCRAASWLECERWYVGMAVPEGGVGGSLGVAKQLDIGAVAPKS